MACMERQDHMQKYYLEKYLKAILLYKDVIQNKILMAITLTLI